ncbi:hypothetical protein [Actinomadura mexicana]|uniref:Uncharacterized protein n=1 Tax=Actinomadura mexicana TaxID=134959 RepID=A0A239CSD9_9ACTN|nr:hypothetical protein [Actinomadura mexicana]SNS22424.1 hypothetical protein SAMN06265355_11360 [Actinomadura mexicana]
MSALELRYRRLLACYPAGHRAEHGEEMLDVLMSAARPEQTRPSLADAADLLSGAVRIRLRRAAGDATGSPWPGAFAVAGFVSMLMLLADGVRFAVNIPQRGILLEMRLDDGASLWGLLPVYYGTAPFWLAWAAITVLAWRGARRHAATAACTVTAAQIVLVLGAANFPEAPYASVASSTAGVPLPLALLATASLVASPGPRHGARLLGRARVAGVAAMAGVLVALTSQPLFTLLLQGDLGLPNLMRDPDRAYGFVQTWSRLQLTAALVIAVVACAALSRSGQGRRACALLAMAGLPLLVRVGLSYMEEGGDSPILTHLLVECLAGFAVTMLCVRLVELPLRNRAPGRPGKA